MVTFFKVSVYIETGADFVLAFYSKHGKVGIQSKSMVDATNFFSVSGRSPKGSRGTAQHGTSVKRVLGTEGSDRFSEN